VSARLSSRTRRLRLLSAALPALALLLDILAVQQGQDVWRHAAGVAVGLGAVALLADCPGRSHAGAALLASFCLAASLGVRVLAPLAPQAQHAVGTWITAFGLGVLLLSGALLEGLANPDRALRRALETEVEPSAVPKRPVDRAA
jgi:hypothetical protein